MAIKHAQIEHETLRRLYLDLGDLADCAPDDPRLPALADRVAAFIEAAAAEAEGMEDEHPISDDLVALLDAAFLESFPCAPRLLDAPRGARLDRLDRHQAHGPGTVSGRGLSHLPRPARQ